jgi:hypothetical protein
MEPDTAEASPPPTLHVFCAQGEYEAHWIVASDLDDARSILTEYVKENWSEAEIRDWREWHENDPDPWIWHSLADDAVLTMDADDEEDEESMPASAWIARNGRGHLTWGETG